MIHDKTDDIDLMVREERESINKWITRSCFAFLVVWVIVRLSHWIFGFPGSVKYAAETIGFIGALLMGALILGKVNLIFEELRLRIKRIDLKLDALVEAQNAEKRSLREYISAESESTRKEVREIKA